MTGKEKCQEALCRKKNPVCSKMLQTGFFWGKVALYGSSAYKRSIKKKGEMFYDKKSSDCGRPWQ